jgi:hypothetical protein
MESAQFPERKCRETIWSDLGIAHSCEVSDRHPGPHATEAIKKTVTAREKYEADHPEWRSQIDTSDYLA